MNERIKQLAGKALDQAVPQTWTTLTAYDLTKFTEVFAELIIRECVGKIKIIQNMDEITEEWVYDNLCDNIQEHFGVE